MADAVKMMFRILLEGTQSTYNIGGDYTQSILSVAEKIGKILNVPVLASESANPLPGSPESVTLDMSRYQTEFGPLSYIDFDAGLRRTIDWHLLHTAPKS